MTIASDIDAGRRSFRLQDWKDAYARLTAVDREDRLDASALEMLADAAYLIGRNEEATALWTRAHNLLVDCGEFRSAARLGFRLSLTSLLKGEVAIGSGWLERMSRLLDAVPGRCGERGYCKVLGGLRELSAGDCDAALATSDRALALAMKTEDTDLLTLSLLCRGQSLTGLRRSAEGVACLDEAMVFVTSGRVTPIFSGVVYCAVILTCQACFDVERAREWTNAFNSWCDPQPDLVPFRGQCLIHRSEILQMRGDWQGAMKEAERACRWLAEKSEATVGRAHYQKAELHRLFGEFELADQGYHRAIHHGIEPQPGRALLCFMRGQGNAAVAAIRTACGSSFGSGPSVGTADRLRLLGPSVEILLSAGEAAAAIQAAEELAAGAKAFDSPLLSATSAMATGAVMAATNKLDDALEMLKTALAVWRDLGMPYETARTRVKLADVCYRLGDPESAGMYGEAAGAVFRELGASPDLHAIERKAWRVAAARRTSLTRRQMDVLRLLAVGKPNREIASELDLSEHTVARHVSNIFDKTGVSSRAAAVSYAHRAGLLD